MNNMFSKPMFPIFGVIFLVLVYGIFDQAIIHCGGKYFPTGCSALNAAGVFGSDVPAEQKAFDILAAQMKAKNAEYEKAAARAFTTELEPERKEHATLVEKLKGEANNIRQEIGSRYSSRMSWTFLTAVFFLLSISAIGLSVSIFKESVVKTNRWIFRTSIVAVAFPALMYFTTYYMRIIEKLYGNTVLGGHDIPESILNFTNVLGFAGTIFLVASVSAILFSVEEKKENLNFTTENGEERIPETEEQKVANFRNRDQTQVVSETEKNAATAASTILAEKYERQMLNLKFVLYVGGAMLCVAVLQLSTLAEWHRAFLPAEFSKAISSIHTAYFKSSITFQAGIYTIMLGVLYLPAAYIIKEKAYVLKRAGTLPEGTLEQKGLSFNFWDFIPKLLTILSPFLAGSIAELVK